jgi:hypothetical protein
MIPDILRAIPIPAGTVLCAKHVEHDAKCDVALSAWACHVGHNLD